MAINITRHLTTHSAARPTFATGTNFRLVPPENGCVTTAVLLMFHGKCVALQSGYLNFTGLFLALWKIYFFNVKI